MEPSSWTGGGAALLLRPSSVGRFTAKSPSAPKVTEDERAHAGGGSGADLGIGG